MKVFSVCGYSMSGKTKTIELIVRELIARGYKVGSVKEIHAKDFALDNEPSKDTYRHRAAGAELVIARGLNETDYLFPGKHDMKKILSQFDGYDYVVCEGVRDLPLPMIVTAESTEDLDKNWNDFIFCVSGKIADNIKEYKSIPAISAVSGIKQLVDYIEEKVYNLLPNAEPGRCGVCDGDCRTMGLKILSGEAKRSDCSGNTGADLTIDGKRIDMQPFVEKILRKTMVGFISELKGYSEGAEIKVTLR